MSITRETPAHADPFTMAGYAHADDATPAPTDAELERRADAAERMRRGKRLVIGGFVVAVVGIVAYSVVCLGAAMSQDLGTMLLESPEWLAGPMLGVIGLGTLLWLVGSFMYLNGGMDLDPDDPELYT